MSHMVEHYQCTKKYIKNSFYYYNLNKNLTYLKFMKSLKLNLKDYSVLNFYLYLFANNFLNFSSYCICIVFIHSSYCIVFN